MYRHSLGPIITQRWQSHDDGESIWRTARIEDIRQRLKLAKSSKYVARQWTKVETILLDATPEVFDAGLVWLDSPSTAREAELDLLVEVVKFYYKYEFTTGFALVMKTLHAFFAESAKEDLEGMIQILVLESEQLPLSATDYGSYLLVEMGIKVLQERLYDCASEDGAIQFTRDHIQMLQPILASWRMFGGLPAYLGPITIPDVLSEAFPAYFVMRAQWGRVLHHFMVALTVGVLAAIVGQWDWAGESCHTTLIVLVVAGAGLWSAWATLSSLATMIAIKLYLRANSPYQG